MGFIVEGQLDVRDPETGVRVRYGGAFFDSTTAFPFTYTDGDLKFIFSVTPVNLPVMIETEQGPRVESREVASLIDRGTLHQMLSIALRKLGRPALPKDEYARLLQRVRDGLFVMGTKGGTIRKGYMVEFFSSPDELPEIKARIEKAALNSQ